MGPSGGPQYATEQWVPKAQPSDQFGYRVLVGLELTPQNFAGDDVKWRLDMSY